MFFVFLKGKWDLLKLVFFEVEFFLLEVRKDILNFKNFCKFKDNFSKEECYVMKNLKIDDRVIRI